MLSPGVRYMLIATFAFSLMQLCVKFLSHLPVVELVLFRSLVSLSLTLFYLKMLDIEPFGNNKKYLIIRGLSGVMALTMFFYTLQVMPLGSAVTLQYLSPIFTTVIAIFLLRERVLPPQWLFFAMSFTGVVMLKGFDERVAFWPMMAGIGSALFAGLAYNAIRKVKESDHPLVVVFYFPLIATPVMFVASLFVWQWPQGWDWLVIILLGIFTQIGQLNMTKALQAEEASKVTSLKYLGTLYALSYGLMFFGEKYTLWGIMGIVLVTAGVVLNVWYKQRKGLAEPVI
jgi:drug/metabolite transporter (DMT)-like permease